MLFRSLTLNNHLTPYGMTKALTEIGKGTDKVTEKAIEKAAPKQGRKQEFTKPQNKTGNYGEKREPGDYLK